ncbi:MAG TPA: ATP-binding protein, partial [Candidatus Nanopelagicales bacterium]|nr:ATP-binding protein [Candidatus Nanopelagicales bacterium]
GLSVRTEAGVQQILLTVQPMPQLGEEVGLCLIVFQDVGPPLPRDELPRTTDGHDAAVIIEQLERELETTRGNLEKTVQELEAANEDLKSSNEELLSMNEELQSANEELETSKEEVQQANDAMARANSDLENLLTSTQIATLFLDGAGNVRRVTPAVSAIYNVRPSDVGRPLGHFTHRARSMPPLPAAELVRDARRPIEDEVETLEGTWYLRRVLPYRTAEGREEGIVVTFTDVTERKRAEEALKEADRRKDEFLAILAHELRNPLAPIRNSVQILRAKGQSSPELDQSRNVIDRQVEHLTRLVDDLLDVSRITRGITELRKERVVLSTILERALETSRPLIEARRHAIDVAAPTEPVHLDADTTRLAQVFSNLLSNAAKYTPEGGRIRLGAELHGGEIVVSVQDDGVGIPPGMHQRIFDMFMQVDTSLERSQGGLGIGLTIAKRLVEMHGGTIGASSDGRDQGCEFTVRLPVAAGEAAPVERAEEPAPSRAISLRVLVADDNQDSAESLALLLEIMGHRVWVVHDGPEALAAARELRPDIAVMDIGMPGMSGYDVARRIRDLPELAGVVLVAMTGWGQEEDRRRSREAGFDHHLVKPVDDRMLKKIFADLGERVERVTAGR